MFFLKKCFFVLSIASLIAVNYVVAADSINEMVIPDLIVETLSNGMKILKVDIKEVSDQSNDNDSYCTTVRNTIAYNQEELVLYTIQKEQGERYHFPLQLLVENVKPYQNRLTKIAFENTYFSKESKKLLKKINFFFLTELYVLDANLKLKNFNASNMSNLKKFCYGCPDSYKSMLTGKNLKIKKIDCFDIQSCPYLKDLRITKNRIAEDLLQEIVRRQGMFFTFDLNEYRMCVEKQDNGIAIYPFVDEEFMYVVNLLERDAIFYDNESILDSLPHRFIVSKSELYEAAFYLTEIVLKNPVKVLA